MNQAQVKPVMSNLLSEVEVKRVIIIPRIKQTKFDRNGEYVTISEQLMSETWNNAALQHLRSII